MSFFGLRGRCCWCSLQAWRRIHGACANRMLAALNQSEAKLTEARREAWPLKRDLKAMSASYREARELLVEVAPLLGRGRNNRQVASRVVAFVERAQAPVTEPMDDFSWPSPTKPPLPPPSPYDIEAHKEAHPR